MPHSKVNIHDEHGNVIGGFPFLALAPLIASAVGPILNKILGNGAHSVSHPMLGHQKIRKTKSTKKGNGMTDAEAYLVPQVLTGQSTQGGGYWKGYMEPGDMQYGGISYPRGGNVSRHSGGATGFGAQNYASHGGAIGFGGSSGIPLNIGVKGNIGGKGRGSSSRRKKGGYAVDQMHSNAYSGFSPGNYQTMFPVSQV